MKNKRTIVILFIIILIINGSALNAFNIDKKQDKVKIIKPKSIITDIREVKTKYKIFKEFDFDYTLTKTLDYQEIKYEHYDVKLNNIIIYDAKVTIVRKGSEIAQILYKIPEDVEFQKMSKTISFDKSAIDEYVIGEPKLIYYYFETENIYKLVWKVNANLGRDNYLLFIDSTSGGIIRKTLGTRKATLTGTVNTLYNGNQSFTFTKVNQPFPLKDIYRLSYDYLTAGGWKLNRDDGEYKYFRPWYDDDNNWTGIDTTYATAFWTLQKTQYFFKNILSFNYSQYGTVDVNIDSTAFIAEYNPSSKEILYSFKVSTLYNSPVSIDILAHEYGHHVISSISNGMDDSYYMESGAINEGYADIFGKSVQNYIEGYNLNRIETFGEDVIISDLKLKRSANNPNSMGHHYEGSSTTPILGQPDTYQGTYWYNGFHDQGGVHVNNGVINFWFYLLSKGGSGTNDFNDTYNVTGIGIEKGVKIVYNSLPLLLYEAEFTDARNATILAAENLYGIGSNESKQVLSAWEAVGVDGICLSSELVGPSTICSGATFSITNPSFCDSIRWDASPNLQIISGQDPTQITVNRVSDGNATISAAIINTCSDTITLTRNFNPFISALKEYDYQNCNNISVTATASPGASVVWETTNGLLINGMSSPRSGIGNTVTISSPYGADGEVTARNCFETSTIYFNPCVYWDANLQFVNSSSPGNPMQGEPIEAEANPCYDTDSYRWYIDGQFIEATEEPVLTTYDWLCDEHQLQVQAVTAYGVTDLWENSIDYWGLCGYFMALSPNPASDYVEVSISTESTETSQALNDTYTVRVLNIYGFQVYHSKKKGDKFNIPVSNLKEGIYIVEASNGKKVARKQLIVKND